MQTPQTSPVAGLSNPAEGTWRVIGRELKQAPRQARRALLVSFIGLDVGIAGIVLDIVTGTTPEEIIRLISVLVSIFGMAFLMVAQVLHQVSQGLECRSFTLPHINSQRYHRALVAVPLLATIAVILISIGIGILLTKAPDPMFVALIVLMSAYLLYAARFVHLTTRFLHRHAAEQAEAAARAQAEAAQAQLSALQSQMNPHFLFNALNTVAALVRTNGRAAEATVEHLAEVLRRTLDRSQAAMGTVAEEIDYLRAYLAIEQERFGQRLHVDWQLDPEALPQRLPPLTLQPLVENALRHGIGARLEGGLIRIAAARNNGHLELRVSDNGIGFPLRHQEGTGLGNLRQRLRTLYGERGDLHIDSTTTGSVVTLTLPADPE